MLKYYETNWQSEEGLDTNNYRITFEEVRSESTVEEQKKRSERLSLVKFFHGNERSRLLDICHTIKKINGNFSSDEHRRFHVTLLGFPVVEPDHYNAIIEKINQYFEVVRGEMMVKFDVIRLGTKYANNNTLKPVNGISNGTLIAFGDSLRNSGFITFGNKLTSFLLDDEDLNPVLGRKFRRRFPTVWCTMGYYTTDFKITTKLETLFNKYQNLDSNFIHIPCYEIELGTSHYKDLRDWKRIRRFSLATN